MRKNHTIRSESEEDILGSADAGGENRWYSKVKRRACIELAEFSRELLICDSAMSSLMADVREGLEKGNKELAKLAISRAKKTKMLNKLDKTGFTVLHHATRYNRLEAIQDLLENGAHVNIRSAQDGLTPLHIAARFGWTDITKILLQHGACPTTQSENGYTPLHQACKQGNKQIVSLLLDFRNIDCNIKDNSKMTPLHLAAIQGDDEVCQMLMDKGADYRNQADDLTTPLHAAVASGNNKAANVILKKALAESPDLIFLFDVRDIDSNSILHLAALNNNMEIARTILEHGAFVDDTTSSTSTPLHLACAKGHVNMMKLLTEKKADVEAKDSDGRTALHICAQFNQTKILAHLLDNGADVESRDFTNRTPLLAAAAAGHSESVLILISRGADVTSYDSSMKNCVHLAVENGNFKTLSLMLENEDCLENLNKADIRERVPLHYAVMCDDVKVLRILLNKQNRFVFHDENQKTPLHLACESGRAEQAKDLAQTGSSVNDRNDEGKTALHIAASCGHRKVCSKLLSLGADVNIRDNNRWTPLMCAAQSDSTKTCSDFLSKNASIDDINNEGNSALLIATRSGHVSVVRILLDRGASVTVRNNEGAFLVEVAAKYDAYDVMMEVCQHQRWREVMEMKDNLGHPPMKILIQHFPDAAKLIMNRCVYKAPHMNQSDPNYTVTYDFSLLDPGPDDPAGRKGHRYFGPLTMVHNNRQQLLEHPLTQELLDKKWMSFGRFIFYFNFILYIIFSACFTSFVVKERAGLTFNQDGNVTIDPTNIFTTSNYFTSRFSYVVMIFAFLQLLKECVQMALQRLNYFKDLSNIVEWGLYTTAIIFMAPYVSVLSSFRQLHPLFRNLKNPHYLWVSGVISIFLCYMNFVLFTRRFRITGTYVTMFLQVFKTIWKVMAMFSVFVVAFALVFYIIFKEKIQFQTLGHAIITVAAMMVGELNYVDTFVVPMSQENPISITAYFFCFLFLCIISLAIMNLLIGLAVGDIDCIKRDATLKRLAMQVEFVAEIENKYPRFVTRRYYRPVVVTYPNRRTLRMRLRNQLFSIKLEAEKLSPTELKIEDEKDRDLFLYNKIKKTQKQVKSLVHVIEMQNRLLKALAKKIDPDFDTISLVEEDLVQVSDNVVYRQEEDADYDVDDINGSHDVSIMRV